MKCSNLQRTLFFLPFFLSISLITYAKTGNVNATDMSDSVVAGDTAIIRLDVGDYNPDKLFAELRSWEHYPIDFCPECTDTIWSYTTELYIDTLFDFYFDIPLGTYPGPYSLFVHYESKGNIIREYGFIWVMSPPYIFRQPEDVIACQGDSAKFEFSVLMDYTPGSTYRWYHNSILYPGSTWSTLGTSNVQFQDTGFYYCIVSNWYGVDTTDIVRLDLEKMPFNTGPPEGTDRFCPGSGNTRYAINSDPNVMSYKWHLLPAEAGSLLTIDTSTQEVAWNHDYTGIAGLFVSMLSGKCGEVLSDTLEIAIPGPSESPGICIVGIDEVTGKYHIVWEKSGYEDAQFYKIYRESNQADVYVEIGSVNPEELSVFVDLSSAPDILSHRYKISYIDSCGNESELSAFHQTMHLSANMSISNDVNLIWSEYKGIAFPAYEIYRGNQPDSMKLLTQVPSTVTAYKDSDPPSARQKAPGPPRLGNPPPGDPLDRDRDVPSTAPRGSPRRRTRTARSTGRRRRAGTGPAPPKPRPAGEDEGSGGGYGKPPPRPAAAVPAKRETSSVRAS